MSKLKCPTCDQEKLVKDIVGLRKISYFGYEFECDKCKSTIARSPLGSLFLILASIFLIIMNWPGSNLSDSNPLIALLLLILAGVSAIVGMLKLKLYVSDENE